MGFVPKWHGRHLGAFGEFNRPVTDLRSDLLHLAGKCRTAATRLQGPFAGKDPLDALRHQYGHIMQLDVIFQPIKGWFPVREKTVKTHSDKCRIRRHVNYSCDCKSYTQAFAWGSNPVWDHAPNGALKKARRLCSTLNCVVSHGYLSNLTHDLMRIAKMIWLMSVKDFFRLCRRICARIAQSVRVYTKNQNQKSPDPAASFATLTANPANPSRVTWLRTRRSLRKKKGNYIPRYVPPFRRKRYASQACEGLKSLVGQSWRQP